jgi:hypothetical protein
MLEEIKYILEAFEFFTDELQGNRVNISRVYPGVIFLKEKLKPDGAFYTKNLRKNLLESLKGLKAYWMMKLLFSPRFKTRIFDLDL